MRVETGSAWIDRNVEPKGRRRGGQGGGWGGGMGAGRTRREGGWKGGGLLGGASTAPVVAYGGVPFSGKKKGSDIWVLGLGSVRGLGGFRGLGVQGFGGLGVSGFFGLWGLRV